MINLKSSSLHFSPTVSWRMHLLGSVLTLALCFSIIIDAGTVKPWDKTTWIPSNSGPVVTNAPAVIGNSDLVLNNGDKIIGIGNRLISSTRNAASIISEQKVNSTVPYLVIREGKVTTIPVKLSSFRTANKFFGFFVFLSILYILTGFIVYRKGHKAQSVRLFFRMSLLFSIFFLTNLNGPSYFWGDMITRNTGAFARFLLPAIFLHFFLVFPEKKISLTVRPYWEPALYLLPLLFYTQFTFTQITGNQPFALFASRWMILGLYFSAGVLALLHSYISISDPLQKQRMRIITAGTLTGIIPFLALTVLPGINKNESIALWGIAPLVVIPLSFGYSIARYKVMNIEVLLKRSIAYTVTTGLVIGTYIVATIGAGTFILNLLDSNSKTIHVTITILTAALLWPLRSSIQSQIDASFFRNKGSLAIALSQLSKEISDFLNREMLIEHVSQKLCSLLAIPSVAFYLPDENSEWELISKKSNLYQNNISIPAICNRLQDFNEPYWIDRKQNIENIDTISTTEQKDLADRIQERRVLSESNIALLIPMNTGNRLTGIIAIPHRADNDSYTLQDLELLSAVSRQVALQIENSRLYAEELAKQKLEEQLELARTIQNRLLPSTIPEIDNFSLSACNINSAEVSGDYYDIIQKDDGTIAIIVSDVSGKGIPASLLASSLQASLRAHCQISNSPAAILTRVNKYLYESTDPTHFATLFLAFFNPNDHSLTYSSGGHNPPILIRTNNDIELLETGGLPIGAFEFSNYEEGKITINSSESLLMYTDGLTETFDNNQNEFGESRVEKYMSLNRNQTADAIVSGLLKEARSFSGKEESDDDITIVVLQAKPKAATKGADC